MAGRRKVAVLQHDADLAELSRMVLESLGYEVHVLDHALDPVPAIETCHPDVLVMDLRPRPAHCWETLERLAENPDTESLPVVAVVALEKDVKQALSYPSTVEVLLAPYGIDELAEKVTAAIQLAPLLQWRKLHGNSMEA